MTTIQMLQALSTDGSENVRDIAKNIIEKKDTIEFQRTICGDFLLSVFDGDYKAAFARADHQNKHAFLRWLIANDEQEKADYLIKKNFFNYRDQA